MTDQEYSIIYEGSQVKSNTSGCVYKIMKKYNTKMVIKPILGNSLEQSYPKHIILMYCDVVK